MVLWGRRSQNTLPVSPSVHWDSVQSHTEAVQGREEAEFLFPFTHMDAFSEFMLCAFPIRMGAGAPPPQCSCSCY